MMEYFPERRKSSTDLLPLPKAMIMHRSPSPSKRSFSDLLSPFHKKSCDDSMFFIEKQEPNAKRASKIFPNIKHKISVNKHICEDLNQYLQDYNTKDFDDKSNDAYSFIGELNPDIAIEIFHPKNSDEGSGGGGRSEKVLVLWELITSEIMYLKQMYFIITKPMQILSDIKEHFFNKLDINLLFGNFQEIFRSNVVFWTDHMEDVFQLLKASRETPNIRPMVAGFSKISKYFLPYQTYCMNISSSCEYISKYEEESEAFKLFTEWCRNSDVSNRLGLDTFITLPFQRITRYALFLERISKECTDEEEVEEVLEAISEVYKFVNNINKKVKAKDLTSKLHFFQNILNGFPTVDEYIKHKFAIPPFPTFNLTCPMLVKSEYDEEVRCLIHQDTLLMKKLHKKKVIVKLLLFTDLIIIAKPIKKNQQCRLSLVEHPVTLDQLVLCNNKDSPDESCFYMAQLNNFGCFTNIIKFSTIKSSSRKCSGRIFQKKIELAKVNYETIMFSQASSNVHINIINPEEICLFKEDDTPQTISADQQSENSSTSENESDCDFSDRTTKSTSSNSWTDLENNLNSCIITDPFISYSDNHASLNESTPKLSHRLSLQNVSERLCRKTTDSLRNFAGDVSLPKNDSLWNLFRRSSLGTSKTNNKTSNDSM